MADEINKLLNAYHSNTLWEIAGAAGLAVVDSRKKRLPKREIQRKMKAEFFTKKRVLASLKRLNKRERAVLDRLLLRGGTASTQSLRRETLRAGLVTVEKESNSSGRYYSRVPYADGYAGRPNNSASTEFVDVIARLTFHGLVFSKDVPLTSGSTPYKLQFHPSATVFVPQAIRRHLPQPEPLPVEIPDWQPDQVRSADAEVLLRDLYLYWDLVRRNQVTLLQAGFVGKRSLQALNKVLLEPDPLLAQARREDDTERLYLLRNLLEKLGLVRKEQGRLRPTTKDATHIPDFWQWPLPRQLKACLGAWSKLGTMAKWEKEAAQYAPRYSHARKLILTVLKSLPPNAWFELEEVFEEIQDRDADFLFTDRTRIENYRGSWYYGSSGTYYYGSTQELRRKFAKYERAFVESTVLDFLHCLGVTDLGHVKGKWQAFRLTPLGQAMLKTKSPSAPQQERGKLIIQPSFQLLAIGPVNLGWLATLDLFAQRERADRGAFEYHLSRDSVYRAQQLGLEVSEILSFLQKQGDTDLPQNVRRSLEEWGAHHKRIVFRRGVSLLQAADEELLADLLEQPQTGPLLARSVAADVALLKPGREEALIARLVAQGLFPAVSGAEPAAADDSVLVQADGTIQPVHAVPSLHLRGRLDRMAEETDGGWRLTQKSVRRAGGSKAKVRRMLEELAKLQRGQLPEGLAEQLKAWGGYYGKAAAETLTLIEFRDQDALAELRTRPGLRERLTPFPAGKRALAVVQAGELEKVRELLADFGVSVREGL